MKIKTPERLPFYFSAFLGVCIVIIAFSRRIFFEDGYSVNYDIPIDPAFYQNIHFTDEAQKLGIDYHHSYVNPSNPMEGFKNQAIPPSVSVVDLNGDGYMDLVFSGGSHPVVYLNENGTHFKKVENAFGFDHQTDVSSSMVIFADLNNDGIIDALVSGHPKHYLYYGEKNKSNQLTFKDVSQKLNYYMSNPDAVNFVDFNNDGRLDLVFGNITAKPGEPKSEVLWLGATRYDNTTGGSNDLLLQTPEGDFKVAKNVDFKTRSYTHSVGVADLNRDGYPDFFIANDYANDELFYNHNGESIDDVTDEKIPRRWHGNSGMNGEIFDYNNDGLLDIYVTNIYKPPFYNSFNILWEQQKTGEFKAVSIEKQVGRCGFSWGAKFADIDNDGEVDLIVTNGRNRPAINADASHTESLWYRRSLVARIPNVLRQYYYENKMPHYNFSISAYERDCLFVNKQGKFWDIAPFVGITSTYEGRGLALIDVNNDGRMDYVVANINGPAEVYINHSQTTGHWLGVNLINAHGSPIPIGAKITLTRSDQVKMYREYYPANGYRSQSDPRLHFGLGQNSAQQIKVQWNNHHTETFEVHDIDKYITLKEGHGHIN